MSTDRETARELAHRMEAYYSDCPGPHPEASGNSFSCDRLAAAIEAREAALRSQLTEARERCACQEHSVLVQLENLVTDVRRERDAARAALAQAEADRDEVRAELSTMTHDRNAADKQCAEYAAKLAEADRDEATKREEQARGEVRELAARNQRLTERVISGTSVALDAVLGRERDLKADVARLQGELADREAFERYVVADLATARASLVAERGRKEAAEAQLDAAAAALLWAADGEAKASGKPGEGGGEV